MDEQDIREIKDAVGELRNASSDHSTMLTQAVAEIKHLSTQTARMDLSLDGIHRQFNDFRLSNQRDGMELEARVASLEEESGRRAKIQIALVLGVLGAIAKFAGEAVMYVVRKLP